MTAAQTISITVKGITVFMTEYEYSNCSSSVAVHSNQSKEQAHASSVQENDAASESGTNNEGTIDCAYDGSSGSECEGDGSESEGEDDGDYVGQSKTKNGSSKKSKKIGLTLVGINVICEVPFYFVCICQKCYIISV